MKQRFFAVAMIFLALMFVVFGALTVVAPKQAEAQYSVPCYREQGGAKAVAGSGCEYEYQSGSTLDIQSGTTVNMAGNFSSDGGAITYTDNVFIDGQADVVQLTVQGHTTQTSNLLVLENSSGTDKFVVDGSGNVTTMGDFDEAVVVDGEADEVQLTVSGYTTQTSALLVLENSSGTDQFVVDGSGNVTTMGDFDEAVVVDGEADEVQLTVSGYTTQTNSPLVVEQSDGTDVFKVANDGTVTLENGESVGNNTDGLIDFGGGLIYNSTTITVTDGETITPTTYTGYRLNAASEVTITLAACSSDFQPLFLYGEDAQTINVADSNIRTSDGNAIAFDQYDMVEWQCTNSEWNLVYEANNQ